MTTKAKLSKGNTLVYGNRKEPETKWDISTSELRAKAFLELFNHLKTVWKVFTCGYWGKTKDEQETQKALYNLACGGDAVAAEKLLTMRIDYEYEEWQLLDAPVGEPGEPKKVLAKKPGKVYVKDIRKQRDGGNYSFQLSNGEEIEMMYVPVNTTRPDWENGYLIHHFLIDSFYEKLGRDRDSEEKVTKLLSHINFMRLVLNYSIHPEFMPLGRSLDKLQERAFRDAESYIEEYGANPVEKLKDKKVRPTTLQKANDTLSATMFEYEMLIGLMKQLVNGKYDAKTIKEHDLPRYEKRLAELKKGAVEDDDGI